MDRLRKCMGALRVLTKSSQADPFLEVEMRVNEFVKAEGGGLAPLEEEAIRRIETVVENNTQLCFAVGGDTRSRGEMLWRVSRPAPQ